MSEFTKEYRIAQLLSRKIAGELTPEEKEELTKWEKESSTSLNIYKKISNPENKQERDKYIYSLDTESSWKKIRQQIPYRKKTSKNLYWWFGTTAAAAILIILMNTLLQERIPEKNNNLPVTEIHAGSPKAVLITAEGKQFYLTEQDSSSTHQLGYGFTTHANGNVVKYSKQTELTEWNPTIRKHTIQVPRGGEYELILPDGTHVWINSDSQLSFPVQFDSTKREVSLTGEAFFAVTKDKKPFIVKINEEVEIKVLGTQFNIQAYQDENTIETTLCEGSVNVSDRKHQVTLTPSQQAVYSKTTQNFTTSKVDTRLYTSWRKGLFVFENKPLEEIMNTLSRWYDIQVFYTNQSVKTYHFTGDLERYGDFRKTLSMIEKATSIRFIINGKNIIIEEVQN